MAIIKMRRSKQSNALTASFSHLHNVVLDMMALHEKIVGLYEDIVKLNGNLENLDGRSWIEEYDEILNDAKYMESVFGFYLKKVFVPFAMNLLKMEFSNVKHEELSVEELKEILNLHDDGE